MTTITDNLIADLKLYIKENYKLISFAFGSKKEKKPQRLSEKARGIRGKSFGEVTDLMSLFIKDKKSMITLRLLWTNSARKRV